MWHSPCPEMEHEWQRLPGSPQARRGGCRVAHYDLISVQMQDSALQLLELLGPRGQEATRVLLPLRMGRLTSA